MASFSITLEQTLVQCVTEAHFDFQAAARAFSSSSGRVVSADEVRERYVALAAQPGFMSSLPAAAGTVLAAPPASDGVELDLDDLLDEEEGGSVQGGAAAPAAPAAEEEAPGMSGMDLLAATAGVAARPAPAATAGSLFSRVLDSLGGALPESEGARILIPAAGGGRFGGAGSGAASSSRAALELLGAAAASGGSGSASMAVDGETTEEEGGRGGDEGYDSDDQYDAAATERQFRLLLGQTVAAVPSTSGATPETGNGDSGRRDGQQQQQQSGGAVNAPGAAPAGASGGLLGEEEQLTEALTAPAAAAAAAPSTIEAARRLQDPTQRELVFTQPSELDAEADAVWTALLRGSTRLPEDGLRPNHAAGGGDAAQRPAEGGGEEGGDGESELAQVLRMLDVAAAATASSALRRAMQQGGAPADAGSEVVPVPVREGLAAGNGHGEAAAPALEARAGQPRGAAALARYAPSRLQDGKDEGEEEEEEEEEEPLSRRAMKARAGAGGPRQWVRGRVQATPVVPAAAVTPVSGGLEDSKEGVEEDEEEEDTGFSVMPRRRAPA